LERAKPGAAVQVAVEDRQGSLGRETLHVPSCPYRLVWESEWEWESVWEWGSELA
jgi:hypothetical protein